MTFEEFITATLPVPHAVSAETHSGIGDDGDTYAAAATVSGCYVERKQRLVAVGGGVQVTSGATIYAPYSKASTFTAKSRVTLPDTTTTVVIQTLTHDDAGTGLPAHVEVLCE